MKNVKLIQNFKLTNISIPGDFSDQSILNQIKKITKFI